MENSKSLLAVALELLTKSDKPMSFFDLFNAVAEELKMNDDEKKAKISQFYTNLSLDGNFVVLADNTWALRDRVPFEKVHIDMNDAYNDKDDEGDDDSDGEEEKELGEDEDAPVASEDNYEDDDSGDAAEPEESKDEEVKKELGV